MSRSVQRKRMMCSMATWVLVAVAATGGSMAQAPDRLAREFIHPRSLPLGEINQPEPQAVWTVPYEVSGSPAALANPRGVATSVSISLHRGSLTGPQSTAYSNILDHFVDAVFEATEGAVIITDIAVLLDGQPAIAFGLATDTPNIVWLTTGVPSLRAAGGIATRGGHVVMFDVFDNGNAGADINFLADATSQRQGGYILAALWLQYFLGVGAEFAESGGDIAVRGSVLADPFTPSIASNGAGLNMSATLDGLPTLGIFDLYEHTRATPQHRLYGLSALATVAQNYGFDPKSGRLIAKRPRTFYPGLAAAAGPADVSGPATNVGSLPGGGLPGMVSFFDNFFVPVRIASENTMFRLTDVHTSDVNGCTFGQGLLDVNSGEPVILEFPVDSSVLSFAIDIYDFPFVNGCFDSIDDMPNLSIVLTDPLGREFNPTSISAGLVQFQISPAVQGSWQIRLEARAFDSRNIAIDVYGIMIGAPSPITVDYVAAPGNLASDTVAYPNPIVIQVNATFGLGVQGAVVEGILTLPTGSRRTISLMDDGRSPDLIAGDGSYAGYITYNQNGNYVLEVVGYDDVGAARLTYTGTTRAPALGASGVVNVPTPPSIPVGQDVMRGQFYMFTVAGNQADDRGDTFLEALANPAVPFSSASIAGKIDTGTDVDYYRFITPASRGVTVDTVVRVTSVGGSGTPVLRIFDTDGLTEVGRGGGGPSGYIMARLELTPSTEYFAAVERGSMGILDTYSFSVGRPITSDTGSFGVGRNVPPGGGGGGGGGGGCFIATAAYGTPLEVEINALRDTRDAYLLTNALGAAFSDTYYRLSPPVADWVAQHGAARSAVRGALYAILHPAWLAILMTFITIGFGTAAGVRSAAAVRRRR